MLSMESSSDIARGTGKTVLSMESCQTSLQVLDKLCAEYGKLSDIATGTGKTVC